MSNNSRSIKVRNGDTQLGVPHPRRKVTEEDEATRQPWEMQPWDTSTSYARFNEFYLSQDPPYSLCTAYRDYRRKAGAPESKIRAIKNAPGTWCNWANARDSRGNQIQGALTWKERADAHFRHRTKELLREDDLKWQKRREKLREDEWEMGEALHARAQRMMTGLLFQHVKKESTSEDGTTSVTNVYETTGWREADTIRMLKLAMELKRRGAGEPPNTPHTEDWREAARLAGLDPEELDTAFVYALSQVLSRKEDG